MYCDVKEDDDDDNGEDGADWQKAFFARLKKNRAALAEAYAEAEQVGKAKEAFYLAPRYRATNGTEQRMRKKNRVALAEAEQAGKAKEASILWGRPHVRMLT